MDKREFADNDDRSRRFDESEARYRVLLDASPDPISVYDEKGRITYVNPAFEQTFGWTFKELSGHGVDFVPAHEAERTREAVLKTLTGENVLLETQRLTKDGRILDIQLKTAIFTDPEGKLAGDIVIYRDISERKRAEAELRRAKEVAEAANQAKSVFLANMSHELRTPLNAILGYAQLLRMRRPVNATMANGLDTILQSGNHLLALINDILDLAKIETGRVELKPRAVHLPGFLSEIADLIADRADAKQLGFRFEPSGDLPRGVYVDDTRLRQILLNLMGNAIKFTDAGEVRLRVGLGDIPDLAFHARIRFEVSDTGVGVAADQQARIFEPFEQIAEDAHRTEGTGLGLAISCQLVRLMGGELKLESQPGAGSVFGFEVVLPTRQLEIDRPAIPSRQITGYHGRRRRVLIADDIDSNRAFLTDLLVPLGFDVTEAENGKTAIEQALSIRPDIILMDRRMPIMDGLEAARQIRQMPTLQQTPIIAISASVSEADQAKIRDVGIDAFLPKPIHWPALALLLARHLSLRWIYVRTGEPPGGDASQETPTPDALIYPSAPELAMLYELARMGNISQLVAAARAISRPNPELRPFSEELIGLAKRYEIRRIQRMLKACLGRTEGMAPGE